VQCPSLPQSPPPLSPLPSPTSSSLSGQPSITYISRTSLTLPPLSSKSSSLTITLGISQVPLLTLSDPHHPLLLSHVPHPLSSPGLPLRTLKTTPSLTSLTAPSISSLAHLHPLSSTPVLKSSPTLLIVRNTSNSLNRMISFPHQPKTPLSSESLEEILEATLPLRTSWPPPFHHPSSRLMLPPSHLLPPNHKHPLLTYYLSQRYL